MNTTNDSTSPEKEVKDRLLDLINNTVHEIRKPIDSMVDAARMLAAIDDKNEKNRLLNAIENDHVVARKLLEHILLISKKDGKEATDSEKHEEKQCPKEEHNAVTETSRQGESQKKKIILVAEDNNSNFILDLMILRKDYQVVHAWNGAEAVEMVQEMRPDLVLMDIKMPVMNGYEAFDKIKAIDPTIPIIAITAYSLAEEENKIIEKGFDAYLFKPLNAEEFTRTVKKKVSE